MNISYLPELCMKEISTVLKDNPSGLYRCSLINRHWNQHFLPELWKNPFQESRINSKRLIETLFLCLSPEEKESIQDYTINPITSNPHTTYSKFLQVLDLKKMIYYIEINFSVTHHQLIYEKLCYHFNSNSTNLSKIIFFVGKTAVRNNADYADLFLYPNAKNLSTLKEVEFHGLSLSGLIFNCYKVCRDLQTITFYSTEPFPELLFNFNERYNGYKYFNLKNLIKSQRSLKNLNIQGFLVSENKYLYEAVNSQVSSLISIKFKLLHLNNNCTLDYLVKCKNLEELQILECKFHGNIITKDENHLVKFPIKSKLKYLKFKNCIQTDFLGNYSLIISMFGQNLNCLDIRGIDVLSDSRKVNLITLVATYCHNLKIFKISIIDEHVKYIPSLLSSCQRLQHVTFNTYEQNEMIHIDLSEIGKTMPSSMNRFTLKMNLHFTPENFKEFLINIKDNINLKVLSFRECRLFSNDHLDMLIKHGNGCLRRLKINKTIKIDEEELLRARQFVKIETAKILNKTSND
ncbi:12421_t:CDS:1 [Funneliformis mosseae]|uniref:12421_t:CDS:1 n=1 Tax=Funneliformis mosseae TaxID=27381 RepID=A0A9N9HJW6_FUNMO|nr:12421_t:CDS:1 [Funneliformis mosseae]